MPLPSDDAAIDRLLGVMRRLRDRDGGCPWDVAQTFASIAPYTIEEAYEVADAIASGDMSALREELGDLLLQVVYHAQMASEAGSFDFDTVASTIADKMIARHPHVFGGGQIADAAAQTAAWEKQKAEEREARAAAQGRRASILDGIALALPALMRAEKLQNRAARVGFDWPDVDQVFAKIDEEIGELRAEIAAGSEHDRMEDEVGDLLFAVANLARHLKVDPETALRRASGKFEQRFRAVEQHVAAQQKKPFDCSLDELETIWQTVKSEESSSS